MRAIKFRAWDEIRKIMMYRSDVTTNGEFFSMCEFRDIKIFEQYTGLKDKNGKEIYEGDILETECDEIKYYEKTDITKHIKTNGTVICKWEGYGFYFSHVVKSQHGINLPAIEIIGNIHE